MRGSKEGFSQHCFLIFSLAIITLSTLSCISQKNKSAKKSLPIFIVKDIYGRLVDSSAFRGKATFISFVNPTLKNDHDIFHAIENQFGNRIRLVAITRSWEQDKEWKKEEPWILIADPDNNLLRLFGSSSIGINFVFDPAGYLLGSGANQTGYDEGPKDTLVQHLLGIQFDRYMMHPRIGENIDKSTWLKQLESIQKANTSARYFVFGFFSSICDGCGSGETIRMLKKIKSEMFNQLSIYIILSNDFKEMDISRLQTQIQLDLPCILADQSLSDNWTSLKRLFRPSSINEFVLLVDSSGKILLDFDRNDKNPQDLFYQKCVAIISMKGKENE